MRSNIAIVRDKEGFSCSVQLTWSESHKKAVAELGEDETLVEFIVPDYSDAGIRAIMAVLDLAWESSNKKMPGIALLTRIFAAGYNMEPLQ